MSLKALVIVVIDYYIQNVIIPAQIRREVGSERFIAIYNDSDSCTPS